MRSIPAKTVEHCRSVHDMRHQTTLRHSTGGGDAFGQLMRLSQERERLERRLLIWLGQRERTEAEIAAVDAEMTRILDALEPQIREEAAEAVTAPRPSKPVAFGRRRRAV